MMTTYSLTEIFMQWAVFALCVVIVKQFTRFEACEACEAIMSEHKTVLQGFAFLAYRVVLYTLMLVSLIAMMVAIGYSLGYLGVYRM